MIFDHFFVTFSSLFVYILKMHSFMDVRNLRGIQEPWVIFEIIFFKQFCYEINFVRFFILYRMKVLDSTPLTRRSMENDICYLEKKRINCDKKDLYLGLL